MSSNRSRLAVTYLDDTIVLSDKEAWTYVKLPATPYEFLSAETREYLADQVTLALANLVSSSTEPVEVHLRVVHKAFDSFEWGAQLGAKAHRQNPTPGWSNYLVNMARRVESLEFTEKEVYLGVLLGKRSSGGGGDKSGFVDELLGPLKKLVKSAEKFAQYDDEQVSEKEIERWHTQARDIHRNLGSGHLKATPATANEIAWLAAHPLWPSMDQPVATSSNAERWGAGELRHVAESDVVHHRKWLEVNQIGTMGIPETGYVAVLAFSRFPDVLNYPQQEPWMHFVASLPYPVEFSSRFQIVPSLKVRKDISKKLADAKDQAQHIAEAGTAVPLQVREQLEVATQLEYLIDKDRMPWAYARHRLLVTAETEDELVGRCKTIMEMYKELGIDISWPTGDQLDLLLESMPGDQVRGRAYYQRQDLAVIAGGMPTASSQVGDRVEEGNGWVGPYLGYTTSRVANPVFFSPHVAMTRNYPPGVAVIGSPGAGKALALDTRIPVPISERFPTGWATMEELRRGDRVFAPDGTDTVVLDTSPIFSNHDCYRIVFDDGTEVIADADHEWVVETRTIRQRVTRERRRLRRETSSPEQIAAVEATLASVSDSEMWSPRSGTRLIPGGPSETMWIRAAQDLRKMGVEPVPGSALGLHPKGRFYPAQLLIKALLLRATALRNDQRRDDGSITMTTRALAQSVKLCAERRLNYSIPLAEPLQQSDVALPIDPYALGIWLSDGTRTNATISTADPEIVANIEAAGHPMVKQQSALMYRAKNGFHTALRNLGLLDNKHIPAMYLRASEEQRLRLFAGLCDGDGTVDKRGRQEFSVTNERLALDFRELAHSLGVKTGWGVDPARLTLPDGTRKDCGLRYRIRFTTLFGPSLPRKAARLNGKVRSTTRRRYITQIKDAPVVPVKCITVAHPSHQYLITDSMIPTHNSFSAFTFAYQMAVQGVWTIYIDPKADAKPMGMLDGLGDPKVFDLRDGNDGMLDPFSMGTSSSESKLLALETVRLLLGGDISEEREESLLNAVERVAGEPKPSLNRVVDVLLTSETSRNARALGMVLNTIRDLPFARLCFAPTGGIQLRPEDGLTVVTLLGLDLPSASTQTKDFSYENRLAVSVMYLLTRYARKLMLNMDKNHPKAICIDEAWAITSTPQGAKLIPEIARMGRSHNTALVLVSQNAADLMAESVTNSLSTKFAFRSKIPGEIDAVLDLFGLEKDQGYQNYIRGLRNGECLMQDIDGRVARVLVDAWDRELFDTFNTNPETRGKKTGEGGGGG